MKHKRARVAGGLSGGIDSSIAAALLKEKGYDVVGITMKTFDASMPVTEFVKHACFGPGEQEDIKAAAGICRKLGIPFHVIDLKDEFRDHVIEYFRSVYLAGRTPNPCVVCNRRLKFGFLLEKAKAMGVDFEFFATGHYAQRLESGGRFLLKRAADLSKDQTYFLYALTPEQLSHTLFPVGEYTKPQVREMARSLGLETADRPESQDFVSGTDYSYLFNEEEIKEGDIVDEKGNILGRHRGIIHYTVGQRLPRVEKPTTEADNSTIEELMGKHFDEAVRELKTRLLRRALKKAKYNQKKAAQILGLTYHQFRGLYRKYGEEIE